MRTGREVVSPYNNSIKPHPIHQNDLLYEFATGRSGSNLAGTKDALQLSVRNRFQRANKRVDNIFLIVSFKRSSSVLRDIMKIKL